MPVTVRGEQMAVSGSLTNLNVFDIITGSANFALVTKQVDVDLDGIAGGETLNDATLLTLGLSSLNLSVGAGGAGLAITGGKVGIATIKAPLPTTAGATDTRSWTAITAKDLVISLTLPAGLISASVSNVTLKINKAAGQYQAPTPQGGTAPAPVLATALPWASTAATPVPLAVDLDPAGGWTAPGATQFVDPGQALPTPDPMPIKLNGDQLAVAGSLTQHQHLQLHHRLGRLRDLDGLDRDRPADGSAGPGERVAADVRSQQPEPHRRRPERAPVRHHQRLAGAGDRQGRCPRGHAEGRHPHVVGAQGLGHRHDRAVSPTAWVSRCGA